MYVIYVIHVCVYTYVYIYIYIYIHINISVLGPPGPRVQPAEAQLLLRFLIVCYYL